jgi:hypothetical protein
VSGTGEMSRHRKAHHAQSQERQLARLHCCSSIEGSLGVGSVNRTRV